MLTGSIPQWSIEAGKVMLSHLRKYRDRGRSSRRREPLFPVGKQNKVAQNKRGEKNGEGGTTGTMTMTRQGFRRWTGDDQYHLPVHHPLICFLDVSIFFSMLRLVTNTITVRDRFLFFFFF